MLDPKENSKNNGLKRTFRNLTRDQISDPDHLSAIELMGLGAGVEWTELLEEPRVLIISAAGAGKTHECRAQADELFAEGTAAFFLTLEGIANTEFRLLLERGQWERFQLWANDGHSVAHFFLDSADELLLSHGDFKLALRRLASILEGHLHRANIVVTSRPIGLDLDAFESELDFEPPKVETEIAHDPNEPFRRLISGNARKESHTVKKIQRTEAAVAKVRIVGLTALSRSQIEDLAVSRGVKDVAGLMAEIDRKRAWDFAKRPQELIEICSYWNANGKLGTHSEQVAEDIRRKLHEVGPRAQHVRLSEAKAMDGAERLALAQVLTRKRTIRFSDLSLDTIEAEAAIKPEIVLADWNAGERSELLQRPLFGPASYGRVRFHHRSASEYLAAQRFHRLCQDRHMSKSALFRLLFGECYGQKFVFPSMRAVAAWLAIHNVAVRDEVLRREPEALMDEGDPESFSDSARGRILIEYVRRYGQDDWRGVRIPYPQVLRFASSELSPVVSKLWQEKSTNPEVKELLIDLIKVSRMTDCLDIATEVANDSEAFYNDRITAITALAEMSVPGGLEALVSSLITDTKWPSRVKAGVIDALFPKHMTVEQFVELLSQIEVNGNSAGGIEWSLPRLIPTMKLLREQTAQLRAAMAQLIKNGIETFDRWPNYGSKFAHFSPALAQLCLDEMPHQIVPSHEFFEAAVIANRFRVTEFGDKKPLKALRKSFLQSPLHWRRDIFIAEGQFAAAFVPFRHNNEFRSNLMFETLIGDLDVNDFGWLLSICENASLDLQIRAAAFWQAMFFIRDGGEVDEGRAKSLRSLAEGHSAWLEELEKRLLPFKRDRKWEAQERKWKNQAAIREAKNKEAIESWVRWRDEVVRDSDNYFSKTAILNVVHDFAQVLERGPEDSNWRAHWNPDIIDEHFNQDIALRVADVFRLYWRTVKVSLHSERAEGKRDTIWTNWIYALAGVYAEAETPNWASDLSPKEAERAARIAAVELNGVPPWIEDLVVHHPKAVDVTLGKELTAQLNDAVSFAFPALISDFSRAGDIVLNFFAPRVWDWLSSNDTAFTDKFQQARMYEHLERAIEFIQKSDIGPKKLSHLAKQRLIKGLRRPFAVLWLLACLGADPKWTVDLVENNIEQLDTNARYKLGKSLFAALHGHRSARLSPDLSDQRFSSEILHQFVRIAYSQIRIEDDIDRSETGSYSPTARDDAQHGRDAVLNALLERTGPDAWAVKQAMRSDPLFAHFRDRLDQLARQKAASEAEGTAFKDADVVQLEKRCEAAPSDRNGMFELLMDRLADLQHEIAAHEFSERSILASIGKEQEMQIWFANRLQERANEAYRVDREAMVINAKETDIRLLSVRSNTQAVIEMKLVNNGYSVADLERALRSQLVGQYMQHENCRAGCLLLTMNKPRHWISPVEGTQWDFEAVLAHLQEMVARLQAAFNHEIRLAVAGFDLN